MTDFTATLTSGSVKRLHEILKACKDWTCAPSAYTPQLENLQLGLNVTAGGRDVLMLTGTDRYVLVRHIVEIEGLEVTGPWEDDTAEHVRDHVTVTDLGYGIHREDAVRLSKAFTAKTVQLWITVSEGTLTLTDGVSTTTVPLRDEEFPSAMASVIQKALDHHRTPSEADAIPSPINVDVLARLRRAARTVTVFPSTDGKPALVTDGNTTPEMIGAVMPLRTAATPTTFPGLTPHPTAAS